ncbi:hypothetical protein Pla175_06050 [Pirellulimonas nuda]|uniref:Uncharacterized protein n=1 Tax=Pirellulimonas nuda TaxID=2528009 RepID=A0A518D6Z9_9BACT|nr:hypothetical protein [Pirellulimonas nuda]QDU87247.1 hypothetical protein Pla175_06050 [Pirellulimonas nuda]
MSGIIDPRPRRPDGFGQIAEAFLSAEGLPFAEVISADRIEAVFARHQNLFGLRSVYSTAVMVWSFLGQVLRDGKEASGRLRHAG